MFISVKIHHDVGGHNKISVFTYSVTTLYRYKYVLLK